MPLWPSHAIHVPSDGAARQDNVSDGKTSAHGDRLLHKRLGNDIVQKAFHPALIQVTVAAAIWLLVVRWLYFTWGARIDLDLAVATGFFVIFFTLFMAMVIFRDRRFSLAPATPRPRQTSAIRECRPFVP